MPKKGGKRERVCVCEIHNEKNNPLTIQQYGGRETNLAITKSSLTILEPSPMYFWTNSEPETLMKVQSV